MKKTQILKELAGLSDTKKRLKSNRAQCTKLGRAIRKDEDLVNALRSITIVDGNPVIVWRPSATSTWVDAVADEHRWRSGQVTLNRHNDTTFVVQLCRGYQSGLGKDSAFAGKDWPTKKIALAAVYDWVFNGVVPKMNGVTTAKSAVFV
jgi:predicted alpha-1,6-mannanase (GH76 family)